MRDIICKNQKMKFVRTPLSSSSTEPGSATEAAVGTLMSSSGTGFPDA